MLSLIWEKGQLRLTHEGEQGTYILKPIPRDLENVDQLPANEHLTMQIAKQVFKLNVAENAMIFFENGEPAYITKRFDIEMKSSKNLGRKIFQHWPLRPRKLTELSSSIIIAMKK